MIARGLLAAALSLAACAPTPTDDARQDLIVHWGDWLLAHYDTAANRADALGVAVEALCAAPDAARLEAARTAWQAARKPWKEAEVFGFGPYSDEPIRLGPKADFWPARPDSVRQRLADPAPLELGLLGSHLKGFAVIELMLWDPEVEPLQALTDEPRRCELLRVILPDLAAKIRELRRVWSPAGDNYLGELSEAGERDTHYMTLQMAFGELVNRIGYLIENIRNDKLGKPVGVITGAGPDADAIESPFSGRSLDDIRDNLAGVRFLLLGDEVEDHGLDGYLRGRGRFLRVDIEARLAAAEAAIAAITVPLSDAVIEQPERVEALIARLGELQRVVQVDVLNALSLQVGFNDNDGD